jgi:hypothetical protein
VGHRVVDDDEAGNGEKPYLEGDAGNVFGPEVLEAVGGVNWGGGGVDIGKGIGDFGCIAQRERMTFDDKIDLGENGNAGLPSLEESDVLVRWRNGRI